MSELQKKANGVKRVLLSEPLRPEWPKAGVRFLGSIFLYLWSSDGLFCYVIMQKPVSVAAMGVTPTPHGRPEIT